MLELINIRKKYKDVEVLKGINLVLPDKGLVSIVGESGSGKSTLLNIIGLIEKADKGSIIVDKVNVLNFNDKQIDNYHKNYVSFIFQQYNLIENLSVINNININNDSKDINSIINMLKIKHLLTKKVSELSGGEKQRVVIARSLTNSPKIILADEPTGALDSKTRKIVNDLLKTISRDVLVIMVTHNIKDAIDYSDRIIELKDGVIVKDTNRLKLYNRNTFKLSDERIKISKLFKLTINNIKAKLKRNIITSIAFSIGLISLLLVLSITSGFKDALLKSEKNSLSKYPIIISNTSTNIDNDINDLFNNEIKEDNKVYSKRYTYINKINDSMINKLNNIDNNTDYKVYSFNDGISYNSLLSDKLYDEFNILYGNKISNDNEVIIVIDRKNSIDSYILEYMGLDKDTYDYKDLINKTYDSKTIVGIMKAKDGSLFEDSSFILGKYKDEEITSIYLYPKDYDNKLAILKYLDKESINYTDYSSTVKSLSDSLIKGVSIILICFSFISLIVSTIMIGIITYINIVEKTKEIGILRSLGFSKNNVRFIFLLESISIGLISFIISSLFIIVLSIPINNMLFNMTGINNIFLINYNNIIIILCLSVFLCIIGAGIPLRGISKMNIIDTIRYE